MKPWTNKSIGFGIFGVVLVILGMTLCAFGPALFNMILDTSLMLSPNARAYNVWKDTSSLPPMHLKIYFFNWTNPEELTKPGAKPKLVQVGPYSFRENKQKVNVTFHPENHTVSYFQKKFWNFDPEASNGSLQDRIIQLNPVAVSAAHKVRYWSFFMQNSLSYLLSSTSTMHVIKTVDELLFTGYEDNVIKMGSIAVDEDEIPPFDRFGWFYKRNGSADFDGHYNMGTGEDDIKNLGLLLKWNHKDTTNFYKSPCNTVEGSAGEFFAPNRSKTEDLVLFSSDLCRPLTLSYTGIVEHSDVSGYRYALGEKTLGNSTRRRYPHEQAKFFEVTTTTEDFFAAEHSSEVTDPPETDPDVVNLGQCYCNGECSPSGLINITSCRYGAPAFVSLPHFLKADPTLLDQVEGLSPNEEDHDFFITLEPTTGIPLQVGARLQVNLLLQPSKSIAMYKDVPKIYFPAFWFSMKVTLQEEFVSGLKFLLLLPIISFYTGVILMGIGLLISFWVAIVHYIYRRQTNPMDLKPDNSPNAADKKTELIYMDKVNTPNEDPHVRTDRLLYPKLY